MADATTKGARIEGILASVPIFSRLDRGDIRKLAKLCLPRTFKAGETVIEEGDTGLGLFVCRNLLEETGEGRIELKETSAAGTTFTVFLSCDNVRQHPDVSPGSEISTEEVHAT